MRGTISPFLNTSLLGGTPSKKKLMREARHVRNAVLAENLNAREHLREICADETIILKQILRN
jgi:hypothetical protein